MPFDPDGGYVEYARDEMRPTGVTRLFSMQEDVTYQSSGAGSDEFPIYGYVGIDSSTLGHRFEFHGDTFPSSAAQPGIEDVFVDIRLYDYDGSGEFAPLPTTLNLDDFEEVALTLTALNRIANIAEGYIVLGITSIVPGADYTWVGGSGSFQSTSSWTRGEVPTGEDVYFSGLPEYYWTVPEVATFEDSAGVSSLNFLGSSRNIEFQLNGFTMTVGSPIVFGTNSGDYHGLTLKNGSFSAPSFVVGLEGQGALLIKAGATVSGNLIAGDKPGSKGTVRVEGPGSQWTSSNSTTVLGNEGNGALLISSGGMAHVLEVDPNGWTANGVD